MIEIPEVAIFLTGPLIMLYQYSYYYSLRFIDI
jgi:hypothetical protein